MFEITGKMRCATSGGLGGIFCFFIVMSLVISVPIFMLMVLDTGLSIDSNAVVANHKSSLPKPAGKDGELLAEPSEYGLGLSSRMVWSVSSERSVRICTMFTIGVGRLALRKSI